MKRTITFNFNYLTEDIIEKIDEQLQQSENEYGYLDIELYYKQDKNYYIIDCDKGNYRLIFNLYEDDGNELSIIDLEINNIKDNFEAEYYLEELETYIEYKLIKDKYDR